MQGIFQVTIHTITPLDWHARYLPGNDPHDYALRPACGVFSRQRSIRLRPKTGMQGIFQETIHTITPLDRQAGHFPGNDPHDYAFRPIGRVSSRKRSTRLRPKTSMRGIFQETIHTIPPLNRHARHFPGNDPHDYALRPACRKKMAGPFSRELPVTIAARQKKHETGRAILV